MNACQPPLPLSSVSLPLHAHSHMRQRLLSNTLIKNAPKKNIAALPQEQDRGCSYPGNSNGLMLQRTDANWPRGSNGHARAIMAYFGGMQARTSRTAAH